jgi:ABC-type transporter Mla MlaB component
VIDTSLPRGREEHLICLRVGATLRVLRSCGVTHTAAGMGPGDHLCWTYDDRDSLPAVAVEFLAEGIARREKVLYFSSGSADPREEISALGAVDDLIESGVLGANLLSSVATPGKAIDIAEQDSAWTGMLTEALDAGFTGVRVFVDSTPLTRTPEQHDAFLRWEQHFDRRMTEMPFTGVCAFSSRELGIEAATALARVHPLVRDPAVSFRLFAGDDGALVLTGEVGAEDSLALEQLFERLPDTGEAVAVDVGDLRFIAHQGLLALDRHAATTGRVVTLRHASKVVRRLSELLALQSIQIEGRP